MVTRTCGYFCNHDAWRCSVPRPSSVTSDLLYSKWTVSPTLTRRSSALPGIMVDCVVDCCIVGPEGGGVTAAASGLVVQAAKSATIATAEMAGPGENFIMGIPLQRKRPEDV